MHRISRTKLFLAPLFLLLCFAAAGYAQTCVGGHVDLKACGAVGDDTADDSPALQAALDALGAAGGGTLSVPEGRYRLGSPVSKNFQTLAASVVIRGHGSATVFHFASGPGTTNVTVAGAESLLVEDIAFAGTPGLVTDAKIAFVVNGIERATFRRTDWYGVASGEQGGAVLKANLTDLIIQNSSFRGCTGSFENFVPVVLITDWYSTKITDTDFIDYGTLHGVFHSKTPLNGALAWVYLNNPIAAKEARAVFSRMFLDEGAYISLMTQTTPQAIIHFDHIGANVNSTSIGVGLKIINASHATVSNSYFGYASHGARNAIELFHVGSAVIEQTELRDQANRVTADNLTKSLTITNSVVGTLDADAAAITLEDSDIATLDLSPSSQVTTRKGGKLTATAISLGGGPNLTTSNQTGTGSLVLANAPTLAGATLSGATLTGATLSAPTITNPTITGLSLTNPNIGAATASSLAIGGGTPLTTTNRTGTGSLAMSNSPAFITPNLGAATGASLSLGGGTPLTTTNRTGTGNLVLATSPTLTGATLAGATLTGATLAGATITNPTITGASLTNASLVTPNIGAASGTSLSLGGGAPLSTTSQTGTGSLVLSNAPTITSPSLLTPNIGAATGLSLALGGGTPLLNTNQTGTGALVLSNAPSLAGATLAGATLTSPSISNATISNANITGASLSGVTLANPNIGAAAGASLSLGGGAPLATTNQTGTGTLVMSNSPALVTPSLGAARAASLAIGGGAPLTTSEQTGTGALVLAAAPSLSSPNISAPFIAGRVSRTVLQLAPGEAAPSVAGGDVFKVANALPTTVSNFGGGADGQLIILVFSDGNTTIADNPDIRLRGDFTSKPDAVLILIRVGAAWFEISRSIDVKPLLQPKAVTQPAGPALPPGPESKTDKAQGAVKPARER